MTLLNAILAFGALAFTVPLAIHLLFRSRFRTIDWGAMHLLDSVVRINRRRIQLLHLLLLLLRCLLPVLLAFCLARPLLTGFQTLPGEAPQSLAVIVDDSRSMAARDSSGSSRIDRAKQQLEEVFSELSRRDEVILIRSSQIDAPATSMGAQEAIRQLRSLRAVGGPVDLGRMMTAAMEAAKNASHSQRRVVVVSDFQSQLVSDGAIGTLSRLSSRLAEESIRSVVSFLNVGGGSDQLENVVVDSIEIDSPAIVASRGARFSTQIRNASDRPVRDLRLVWSIDGQPLAPVLVSLTPRSTVTNRLSRRIDEVGVHEIAVSVEHGDALVEDNRRAIGVDVIRQINVALVDGQPSGQPLQSETDFLAIALSPFAFGGEDQPDAVRTNVLSANDIEKELKSNSPDILVLANVAKVSDSARQAISRFVLDGGALVIFDGDQLQPDFYNQPWVCEAGSWRLPAEMKQWVGDHELSIEGASSTTQRYAVGQRNSQYTPWDVLGAQDQSVFGDVEVAGYRQLKLRETAAVSDSTEEGQPESNESSESAAIELLSFVGGDPLVVTARWGRGTVVQFAIPGDASSTNLPTRLVYLPMLQQLILDLAGSRKQTTLDVGENFSVAASELAEKLPGDLTEDEVGELTYTLEDPAGTETQLEVTADLSPQLVVSTNEGPGVYRIRQTTPIRDEAPIVTQTIRVAEVPAVESQLIDVDGARLTAAAGFVDAKIYSDFKSLQEDDRTRRYGREIWRWLLIGLLIAMLAELLVEQITVRAPMVRTA